MPTWYDELKLVLLGLNLTGLGVVLRMVWKASDWRTTVDLRLAKTINMEELIRHCDACQIKQTLTVKLEKLNEETIPGLATQIALLNQSVEGMARELRERKV